MQRNPRDCLDSMADDGISQVTEEFPHVIGSVRRATQAFQKNWLSQPEVSSRYFAKAGPQAIHGCHHKHDYDQRMIQAILPLHSHMTFL